ncbi:MAG: hypothetical protein CMM76_13665 [Rhodospirillaceae bacterium]|nr:hypothetical protein [Rhodospirillaceae bacterium]
MKVGDLVHMPGETIVEGELPSVGIIVVDAGRLPGDNTRVGVWWTDSDRIDYEPKDWLEVISESR